MRYAPLRVMAQYEPDPERAAEQGLSPRELEVLYLVAEGLSSQQIGLRLQMSDDTARWHLMGVRRKLAAETTGQACARAVSLGILREA